MKYHRFIPRLLVIDDDLDTVNMLRLVLKNSGYEVTTATSWEEVSDRLILAEREKISYDLVILDMVMPEMSGGEVFDELKKINPQVKVLLSSGYSLNGQESRIIKRGCVGFIQKPFTIRDIASQLRKIIDKQKTTSK